MERFETTVLTLFEGMLSDTVTKGAVPEKLLPSEYQRKGAFPHRRPDNVDLGTIEALLNRMQSHELQDTNETGST